MSYLDKLLSSGEDFFFKTDIYVKYLQYTNLHRRQAVFSCLASSETIIENAISRN